MKMLEDLSHMRLCSKLYVGILKHSFVLSSCELTVVYVYTEFCRSYPTVRNSCKRPKLQYLMKNQFFLCTCSFFLALKDGLSGFLAFINSPDIFQCEYSIIKCKRTVVVFFFFLILIAIHKGLLQSDHPSTESLTH